MVISESVQLAALVAIPAFLSPLLLLVGTRWFDRGDRARAYAREDAVKAQVIAAADQAAKAAQLLVESNSRVKEQVTAAADQAMRASQRLVESNTEQAAKAAKLLVESNARVADAAEAAAVDTKVQLTAIHTLVNSGKTESMESELTALQGQLLALQQLGRLGLRMSPKIQQTVEELAAVELIQGKVKQLEKTLKERAEQTKLANQQGAKS
jgi:hypothetical protein